VTIEGRYVRYTSGVRVNVVSEGVQPLHNSFFLSSFSADASFTYPVKPVDYKSAVYLPECTSSRPHLNLEASDIPRLNKGKFTSTLPS